MTYGVVPGMPASDAAKPWTQMDHSDRTLSTTGARAVWGGLSANGSTMNQTYSSCAAPAQPDATDISKRTVSKATTSDGSSGPAISHGKSRSWSTNGIPSDAVKVTDEFIWLPDAKTGKVYKRRHGFQATYSAGCRCERCTRAYRKARKVEKFHKQRNGGTGRYDGDEIRAHIKWLKDEKRIGLAQIASITGIHYMTLRRYVVGTPDRPIPAVSVIKRNGEKIMAVTGNEEEGRSRSGYVNPELTIHRLRSLAALGYGPTVLYAMSHPNRNTRPGSNIYARMIFHPEGVHKIFVQTAREVRALYREIGDTPYETDNRQARSGRTKILRLATREGWLLPAGWDDPGTLAFDGFEEGEEMPCEVDPVVVDRLFKGDRDGLNFNHAERREAVRLMLAKDVGHNEILRRLKISSQTYDKIVATL